MMNMNRFLAERERISELFSEGKSAEAWEASEALKAGFENLYDYNIAYSMAQSMQKGNAKPDLGIPLYNSTGADLNRVLRALDIHTFTASCISCELIMELENLHWGLAGFEIITDECGKEKSALIIKRAA